MNVEDQKEKERRTFLVLDRAVEIVLNTSVEPHDHSPVVGKLGVRVPRYKVFDGFVHVSRDFLKDRVGDELSLMSKGSLINQYD